MKLSKALRNFRLIFTPVLLSIIKVAIPTFVFIYLIATIFKGIITVQHAILSFFALCIYSIIIGLAIWIRSLFSRD